MRARRRHRPALYPLHLRHHRRSQGHRARQRRAPGGAPLEHEWRLQPGAGPSVVGGVRYRLGGRPLLYRVRAAHLWLPVDPLRGQAGRHPRRRRLLAGDLRARGERHVHRADRVPCDQARRPQRSPPRGLRHLLLRHAVPRRRAHRSRHPRLGRASSGATCLRPLVADRIRLAHGRQLHRPRRAAGQAGLTHQAGAGLSDRGRG